MVGGSETYGKFVAEPFLALLETRIGHPVVNFGCMHAGVSAFSDEGAVLAACAEAEVSVIQIMGAANMSNRLRSVHPRRNDRFIKVSAALRGYNPQVDFTEYNLPRHFPHHLLSALEARDAVADAAAGEELRDAWLGRMRLLVGKTGGRVVLGWMSHRLPADDDASPCAGDLLFIERRVIVALAGEVAGIVEVAAGRAAQEVPGALFHAEVAETLASRRPQLVKRKRPGEGITGPREGLSERFRASR